MRLIGLLLIIICMSGCFKQTRTMQENTQVDLKAQTWAGEVHVTGVIDRTQQEQTELKVELPPIVKSTIGAATSYLTGAGGIAGLAYGWWATRQKRLKLEEAEREKEAESAELAAKRDHYLRELCQGVSMYLRAVDDETGKQLKHYLKEAMSKDTRDAIRDFI